MKHTARQHIDDRDSMFNATISSEIGSKKAWAILSCAWVFYLYEYVLRVSPSVMTNDLMLTFGVVATDLGVLVSFYYLSYVWLQIPCGVIVDALGPRRVITSSALLCVFGCVLFAQSEILWVAQAGRFLMGMGSACAYISATKVGAEWFPPEKFAVIAGITMFMGTMGGTFGASPFAILVNASGWRSAMLISGAVGLLVASVCWFIIRDKPRDGLSQIQPNPRILEKQGLFEGLKIIIRNPQSWLIGLYGCMMYLPLSAFAELWGVPFLMQKYGISNEKASLGSIVVFFGMGLGSILGATISNRIKSRRKVMSGAALGTLLTFLFVFYGPHVSWEVMLAILFLGGAISGGQILYFAAAKEINPFHVSGTIVGFTNFFVMVSGLVFQPLLGFILDLAWDGTLNTDGTRFYSTHSYKMAFTSVLVALFISWLIAQGIRETYKEHA